MAKMRLVVAHPTNETATQTDLNSSGTDFLRNAIAFWNTKQSIIMVGTVLARL